MILKAGTRFFLFIFLVVLDWSSYAQFYTTGTIYYTRRTNLQKRFNDQRMKRFVNEDNKIKNDRFSLAFNDTVSVFKYIAPNATDEMAWLTSTLPERKWKMTESKRTICGFVCRKAIYQKNDSTRIYAWYAPNIIPSVGPEGFCGLPGAIMGIATEDGGIIYFADKVDFSETPKRENMVVEIGKNKVFNLKELREKLEKEYGNTPWGKKLFDDMFRWL
ncbi:MAG: GLPGLI family protein [Flavobacteriia bacterium]|nr:GLPGLI family protein [Flavobacteriia bacterium]